MRRTREYKNINGCDVSIYLMTSCLQLVVFGNSRTKHEEPWNFAAVLCVFVCIKIVRHVMVSINSIFCIEKLRNIDENLCNLLEKLGEIYVPIDIDDRS